MVGVTEEPVDWVFTDPNPAVLRADQPAGRGGDAGIGTGPSCSLLGAHTES